MLDSILILIIFIFARLDRETNKKYLFVDFHCCTLRLCR